VKLENKEKIKSKELQQISIEIDPGSGFCFGVIRVIKLAEQILEEEGRVYCLGDIVHNSREVERLKNRGLVIIDHEEFRRLKNCKVLIRAHGEPPETYETAKKNNITLLDGTCTVVLKLQQRIRNAYNKITPEKGKVVIYGKKGHAEVVGLSGQTNDEALIIETPEDVARIEYNGPIHLFSQTTMNKDVYEQVKADIVKKNSGSTIINCTESICSQVSNRSPKIKTFCNRHDIVIFVSDKKSSNGKMLFEECKKVNPNCFFVSDKNDLNAAWFINVASVGICGATSTPRWHMEEIAEEIKNLK
jgi:4-hydroxy-3-methylbut-2-en-1-yl diphosphate reductase